MLATGVYVRSWPVRGGKAVVEDLYHQSGEREAWMECDLTSILSSTRPRCGAGACVPRSQAAEGRYMPSLKTLFFVDPRRYRHGAGSVQASGGRRVGLFRASIRQPLSCPGSPGKQRRPSVRGKCSMRASVAEEPTCHDMRCRHRSRRDGPSGIPGGIVYPIGVVSDSCFRGGRGRPTSPHMIRGRVMDGRLGEGLARGTHGEERAAARGSS